MFMSSKLTLSLILILTIAIGAFGFYQSGKQTEYKANLIHQQEEYVTVRKKIDAAVKTNSNSTADAALNRLRQRQNK
jgi:uncharacterized protein YxeA